MLKPQDIVVVLKLCGYAPNARPSYGVIASMLKRNADFYAAEPLCRLIKAGSKPIPAWADPSGTMRGITLAPLYKTAPKAAMLDSLLYERLALIDAVRDGRVRERNLAEK